MEGVIDTNILVASLIEDDINHKKARKLLEKLEKWYIPTIVFHEFVWFLKANKLNLKLSLPFLYHEKCNLIGIEKKDIDFAIRKASKKPKEYNDFLILSIAFRVKKQLFTFDEELKRNFRKGS